MMAVTLSKVFFLSIIASILVISQALNAPTFNSNDPIDFNILKPNEEFHKRNDQDFKIYCFDGASKSFLRIWRSVDLLFEHAPLSYEIVTGINASDVREKYLARSMWNPSSWLSGLKTSVEFPAFSNYCVGIVSRENYVLFLQVRNLNYWRLLQTVVGVFLFLSSPSLSRNPFFHYTSGVSLGVIASLLILMFILGRLIPKKSISYATMLFGYSAILFSVHWLWSKFDEILSNYMDYLLAYCVITAFISFIICYRLGPVQNVRTFNIIQWCMQIIAVILIYLSSEFKEISFTLMVILMTSQFIPTTWISFIQRIWYRLFPPKIKLLTELEYIEQGNRETAKALEELRKFCRSPDCNTWKVVRQLKDPMRFSTFIETGSHYTDDELLRYNSESFDDEDDDVEDKTETSNSFSNGVTNTTKRKLFFK